MSAEIGRKLEAVGTVKIAYIPITIPNPRAVTSAIAKKKNAFNGRQILAANLATDVDTPTTSLPHFPTKIHLSEKD